MKLRGKLVLLLILSLFSGSSNLYGAHGVIPDIFIYGSGYFDITNSILMLTQSDYEKINGYIVSGWNNGLWNGPGIHSSFAANDPTHTHIVGICSGEDYISANGDSFYGTHVEDSYIIVGYTLFGDSNMDGLVDSKDVSIFESSLSLLADSDLNNDPEASWYHGDYNYDGRINSVDQAYLVPEPATWILAGFGIVVAAGLRLRRKVA